MRPAENIKRLIKNSKVMINPEVKRAALEELVNELEQTRKTTSAETQPNIWRRIMQSKMTKFATVAAGVVLAVLLGIKIFGGLAEEPSGQTVTQEELPATVGKQLIAEMFYAELSEVRQMAAVGDVEGLSAMLSSGQFESKLVAANFLAKMGGMPAIEILPMYAKGELILYSQSGSIRLRSKNSKDWLEMTAETLWVHTDQGISEAKQVRLTYDNSGDDERWRKTQREFANMRQKRTDLEKELAELNQRPPKDIDQLKKQLAKYNEMLDLVDGAIYVSIENGRLKLNCPTYHRIAFAGLRDEIVQVQWHGHVVEADSITLLHGLAPVRTDGPPAPTPGWQSRFDYIYSLDDDQVLRWVRPPFVPERQIYATQYLHYYSSTDNPPPPGYLYFRWDGKLRNWTVAMHECNLALVLDSIGLKRYEYSDGSEELIRLKLGGDWISRDNVPIEDKLLALEQILQNELGRTIRFEKRKVNREVIIVRGQYKQVPLEGYPNKIYVYPDSWEHFSGPEPVNGGGTGSIAKLIENVGSHFDQPVVFETENLSDITVSYFYSQSYGLAKANAETREDEQEILDSVLQNISKQTSLQFEYGQRDKDVWFIMGQSKSSIE
jgi:hypothetical protein